jgi:hypothetical protein
MRMRVGVVAATMGIALSSACLPAPGRFLRRRLGVRGQPGVRDGA